MIVDTPARSHLLFGQLLRNTAKFGGVLVVSLLCGLATAKILATTVGPKGYGLYGLYNTCLAFLLLFGGLGLPNAFTRLATKEWEPPRSRTWSHLWIAAKTLTVVTGMVLGAAVLILRGPLGVLFAGSPFDPMSALILAGSLIVGLQASLEHATLKTQQRINGIAKLDVATTIVHAAVVITCIMLWKTRGILPAIGVVSLANWLIVYKIRGPMESWRNWPIKAVYVYARPLLKYGIIYWLTAFLTSSASRLAIPVLLLHEMGTQAVGVYTVANTVMSLYTGVLASAMGRDYFPRLASLSLTEVEPLLYSQQQVIVYLGVPAAVAALTFTPLALPMVYTAKFLPAVSLLAWMFAGSLSRYLFWSYAYLIAVYGSRVLYFGVEMAVALLNLGFIALGLHLFGLVGVGLGYFFAQALSSLLAWRMAVTQFKVGMRPQMMRVVVGAQLVLTLQGMATTTLPRMLSLPIGIGLSASLILWSSLHILRHGRLNGPRHPVPS
jgi:antigen flippase